MAEDIQLGVVEGSGVLQVVRGGTQLSVVGLVVVRDVRDLERGRDFGVARGLKVKKGSMGREGEFYGVFRRWGFLWDY
jgi:hypothetical protein